MSHIKPQLFNQGKEREYVKDKYLMDTKIGNNTPRRYNSVDDNSINMMSYVSKILCIRRIICGIRFFCRRRIKQKPTDTRLKQKNI